MEILNKFFQEFCNYHPNNTFYLAFTRPDLRGYPDDKIEPKYDPLYGFPKGRKERKIVATPEELESAKIKSRMRDYCSHHLIKLLACKRDHLPAFWKCHHYKSDLLDCRFEDYLLRMKEYEREKRLDSRNRRIKRILDSQQ